MTKTILKKMFIKPFGSWYWAGGYKQWNQGGPNDPPRCDYLANHLRISMDQAALIIELVKCGALTKDGLAKYVSFQARRYRQEAEEAKAFLKA